MEIADEILEVHGVAPGRLHDALPISSGMTHVTLSAFLPGATPCTSKISSAISISSFISNVGAGKIF